MTSTAIFAATFAALGVIALIAPAAAVGCGGGSEQKHVDTPKGGGDEPESKSSFKPPGDCVDATADGDKHDATRPFDKHVQLDVQSFDLDGDGVVDTFVKPAWSCGEACNRSAYLVRGTCSHYIGTFPSNDNYEMLESKSHGVRDIKARPRKVDDDGNPHCYQVIWVFDGTQYQESKRRECECKNDSGPDKCTAWP